jgi:thiaminase/transcriptional activator TenA
MYYNAYAHENAAYTIAAMAPCPYVYAVIGKKFTNASISVL